MLIKQVSSVLAGQSVCFGVKKNIHTSDISGEMRAGRNEDQGAVLLLSALASMGRALHRVKKRAPAIEHKDLPGHET